jgi:hypothetical protein
MKLVYFTKVLILCLVVLIPGVLAIGIRKLPSGFQPPLSDSQMIYGIETVSQSFIAQKNQLSGFALTIKNPNSINKKDLVMNLMDESGQIVRTVTVNGWSIPDGGYINFSFASIPDSAGKKFIAQFSAPTAIDTDSLELYHSNKPFDGTYKVNGQTENGSLSFITYYAPQNFFANEILIYRNWMWKFFMDWQFAIIYLTLLVGGSAFLIISKIKAHNRFAKTFLAGRGFKHED